MGAWGAGTFDNQTSSDIQGDYRELLEDQVPDDEAARRIISEYAHLAPDNVWLALAASRSQVGRRVADVKARALEADDGPVAPR